MTYTMLVVLNYLKSGYQLGYLLHKAYYNSLIIIIRGSLVQVQQGEQKIEGFRNGTLFILHNAISCTPILYPCLCYALSMEYPRGCIALK